MANGFTRRAFLKGTAMAFGAAGFVPGKAPAILAHAQPNNQLGVAVIGAGGMGGYSVDCALEEDLVALVDVDEKVLASVMREKVKDRAKPKIYHDFRKMLDECHRQIDVVLIATPDHTHAPAAIRAIHLGKHTFCQKPLAHNIRECYVLAKAAREKKVLTQMGNQGQFSERMRRLAEYVEAGAVGGILESHSILGRNFGGKGGRPPSKPVPPHLHWDEWLGPAPYRDYHDGLHPFHWRSWRQFGTGTIGDMACHNINPVFWALKLGEVKRFTVTCLHSTGGSEEMYPQDNIVLYEIPARPGRPAAKVYVYDHAGLKPEIMKETEKKYNRQFGEFTLFVGERGLIGSDARIIPEDRHKEFSAPPRTYARAHGHPVQDLYWCIKNGGTPASNFADAAAPLTALALCGHLAQFAGVGKKIEWDVEKMECTNLPEINQYVSRTYRKGWEV